MRYASWANDVLYQALSVVDERVLFQPRPGRPAGAIGVLGHIYVVGVIWKGHLTHVAHGFRARTFETLPALVELRSWQSELDRWYTDFAARLTPGEFKTPIDFCFVACFEPALTLSKMAFASR